jgi:hypothetical protein
VTARHSDYPDFVTSQQIRWSNPVFATLCAWLNPRREKSSRRHWQLGMNAAEWNIAARGVTAMGAAHLAHRLFSCRPIGAPRKMYRCQNMGVLVGLSHGGTY